MTQRPPDRSPADLFRNLPTQEKLKRLAKLTPKDRITLLYAWREFWARTEQLEPTATPDHPLGAGQYWRYRGDRWEPAPATDDWTYWVNNAGRGTGKTRVGAEWVRRKIRTTDRVSLIAPTAHDIRAVMVEGPSGILAVCPPAERPVYEPSLLRLTWPNGHISELFSADEPERLRGPAHGGIWADELAAWRYADAWDQAQFGLRLGDRPQACITTTPKNVPVFKAILSDPGAIVSRGTTHDNAHNLARTFLTNIVGKYIGTRLGRQELDADLLDDNPGALWQRPVIERNRVRVAPALRRIVVAIDPMGSTASEAAECGIVAAGLGEDGDAYVLDDSSVHAKPVTDEGDGWGQVAVQLYRDLKADRIVAEVNFGGDMVEMVIRTVDRNVPYKAVSASRGKQVRAEPVSSLYQQNRVHHVGAFARLEDELCDWDPNTSKKSPNRLDALVWAITELALAQSTTGLLDWMAAQDEKSKNGANGSVPAGHERPATPVLSKPASGVTVRQNTFHGE